MLTVKALPEEENLYCPLFLVFFSYFDVKPILGDGLMYFCLFFTLCPETHTQKHNMLFINKVITLQTRPFLLIFQFGKCMLFSFFLRFFSHWTMEQYKVVGASIFTVSYTEIFSFYITIQDTSAVGTSLPHVRDV